MNTSLSYWLHIPIRLRYISINFKRRHYFVFTASRKTREAKATTTGTMAADADPNACGVWCFGKTCGCSFLRDCFSDDDDDDDDDDDGGGEVNPSSGKYVISQKEYCNVFTGNTEVTALSISVGGRKSSASESPESDTKNSETWYKNDAYDATNENAAASRRADGSPALLGTQRTTSDIPTVDSVVAARNERVPAHSNASLATTSPAGDAMI